MPVVTVYGVPRGVTCLEVDYVFRLQLKKAVAGIVELDILPEHVSVFFCKEDSNYATLQKDVVVFVDLFEKPQRTDEVLNRLCRVVVNTIKSFWFAEGEYVIVECFVRLLNPQKGFWSSKNE